MIKAYHKYGVKGLETRRVGSAMHRLPQGVDDRMSADRLGASLTEIRATD